MAVISDGMNTYVIRNGKRELVPPTTFGIDGKRVFYFDQNSGALRVNPQMIDDKGLEGITRAIDKSPEKTILLEIPTPMGTMKIPGIKSVSYLAQSELVYE